MPYFEMSTANPTGQRPWDFALQQGSNLGRLGRRRRLGFYFPASYPLPAATIGMGDLLPNMPTLNISNFKGKANYGTPYPVYGPFNPTGSGRMSGMRLGAIMVDSNGVAQRFSPVVRYNPNNFQNANAPQYTVTATGQPLPTAEANMTPQQQQAILAAQQQAAQNAIAAYQQQQAAAAQNSAAAVAAAPSSQIATTAVPAATTAPSWFTDPTQELISGVPNWGLLAGAAVGFMLLKGKR